MIDKYGFRLNVGIILINTDKKVFWGRRVRQDAWQFPQGGILPGETPKEAMYRELYEEVGLDVQDVNLVSVYPKWLRYRLPKNYIRRYANPLCIGQKQKWFLLKLLNGDSSIILEKHNKQEFDAWSWVDYTKALGEVIYFKYPVYRSVLNYFACQGHLR